MKLILRQKMLALLDSYDIYDDIGNVVFKVKSKIALGHEMHIYDVYDNEVGVIKQRLLHLFPTYEIWIGGKCEGYIKKEFTLFRPVFTLNYGAYKVNGDWMEWDYTVTSYGKLVMRVSKKLLRLTDTYEIDVYDDSQLVPAVLIALAIDAEKCSRN